jgi:hypothetical protein
VFRKNKYTADPQEKEKQLRMARIGMAHVQMFIGQNEELSKGYTNSGSAVDNSLNPKDKDFVYF